MMWWLEFRRVLFRSRLSACAQPVRRRARDDAAAPVLRVEGGGAPEMLAGFREPAAVVERDALFVFGCGGGVREQRVQLGDECQSRSRGNGAGPPGEIARQRRRAGVECSEARFGERDGGDGGIARGLLVLGLRIAKPPQLVEAGAAVEMEESIVRSVFGPGRAVERLE